jgi:serine protease Do
MQNRKIAIFGLALTALVGAAVAGLAAQAGQAQGERSRPRVMMLDGRGSQLGVVVQDLDDAALKAAGAQHGVRIDDVEGGSAAARAGLKEGDIVVDVDGDRVRSARQFSRVIQETPEGRSVRLGVLRNGQKQNVDVTPERQSFSFNIDGDRIGRDIERSLRDIEPRLREIEPRLREIEPRLREFRFDGPMSFDFDFPRLTSPRGRLGVQLGELTPQLAEYFGAKEGGVLVSSVTKDSPAEKAGLKAGDVITSINGDNVRGTDDLVDELRDTTGEVTVGIVRDKKSSSVKATLEPTATRTRRPGRPI